MMSIYDDPFMEILDRLIQTGLDEHEACVLLAYFLQERREMETLLMVLRIRYRVNSFNCFYHKWTIVVGS